MPKITSIIPRQAWEYVRDRIANILLDEINNQFLLSGDYDLDLNFYLERTKPFDKTELDAIVVSFSNGNWDNKNIRDVRGNYFFNVDAYAAAASTNDVSGDQAAALKVQKYLGLCRQILEDPQYKTLGFAPPYLSRVWCSEVKIASQQNTEDARNTAMGRLIVGVIVNEQNILQEPTLLAGYDTVVNLGDTNVGYQYTGNSYP